MLPDRPPRGRRSSGFVLVLALAFTMIMILIASSFSGSTVQQLEIRRDEAATLRAEMASESGVEYARRMLALDAAWKGTGKSNVALANGSAFQVSVSAAEPADDGAADVFFTVTGTSSVATQRHTAVVRITPVAGEAYPYALMFLGEDFTMSHGMIYGDVLLADRAHRVNDWHFDDYGDGYYAEGVGPDEDGSKKFVATGVDGTVHKYRDDLPDYQWLGKEEVIDQNVWMPSWELDDFLEPGPGKVILQNPHNMGNKTWNLSGLTYEETVVIELTNKQTVTTTNCHFKGGLVIVCPEDYDVRDGARNLVHLKKGTTIGGGSGGVAPHVGLIAPGGNLKSDNDAVTLTGFHIVNDVDLFKNSSITGQFVVLNGVKDMRDCTITYDPEVTANLPQWFGFGYAGATTRLLSLYEDFD